MARGVIPRWLSATVIGLVLIISGCTAAPGPTAPGGPPPSVQAGPLPSECLGRIIDPDQASAALRQARPGALVCLSGDGLTEAELVLTNSGTPQQPITIVADGAVLRSMTVKADYVVVQGLTLREGDGLTMTGHGLVARNNMIYNAAANGLECSGCVDAVLESNIVQRADGTGIWVSGERITIRNNTISESVARTQRDADGVRFFGNGHRLTQNTIKDIKASGYGGEGPHTDCFQTFNTADNPPTYDVVIADNACTNVDVQCLIATNDERGAGGAPRGQNAIVFQNNTCAVNGSQAVLLRNYPDVIVQGNRFSGPGDRAVMLTEGSTGCAVIGNTVAARMREFEIDPQSEPGFQTSGDSRGEPRDQGGPRPEHPDIDHPPDDNHHHHHGPPPR
jgi:parallel beta-helix repeat protein